MELDSALVEGGDFMEYIPRAIEPYVRHGVGTFKCLLLIGARQSGKSTLLKRNFPDYKYVPLDDPFVEDQAKEGKSQYVSDAQFSFCVL